MKTVQFRCLVLVLSLAAPAVSGHAAILSNVPMQGTMVMPMIKFDASLGRLQVTLDPTEPALTPLLASNPNDSFDPADPWFDCLDPKRQGLAFSRRYGFVMDTMTDPLPERTGIRLRKLAASEGLGIYRYRSTEPKLWEPIFGTDGSPSELDWNTMMFHPGFTAPPGQGSYTAEFEAVLVDGDTGTELAGSGSGAFELTWTSVPDGRPALSIGLKVVIAYRESLGYVLEATEGLDTRNWVTVTNQPVVLDGQSAVVLDAATTHKFFRMRRTP